MTKFLPLLLAAGVLSAASGGKVTFVQNGFFTHPADKGTWKMTGAIVDSGTFAGVCAPCVNAYANLRRTYKGKRGAFVLLHHITVPKQLDAPVRNGLLQGDSRQGNVHRPHRRERGLVPRPLHGDHDPVRPLALLLVPLAFSGVGGKVAWVQNGLLAHPGDRGTWR